MPKVYNVLKASQGPPLWWVIATGEAARDATTDGTHFCHRCKTSIAAFRDADVYLLEGALHHPGCIIEAMGDN